MGTRNREDAANEMPRANEGRKGSSMTDLVNFIRARLDEDEAAARAATLKKYPRWRVWLRRLRHGI